MLHSVLVTLHLALCIAIVGLVLIQRGKGAEAGAGFGAGASGTVFGARGSATFFSKATAAVATLFFATSLALTYVAAQKVEAPKSLVESVPVEQSEPAGSSSPGAALGEDEVPLPENQAPAQTGGQPPAVPPSGQAGQ